MRAEQTGHRFLSRLEKSPEMLPPALSILLDTRKMWPSAILSRKRDHILRFQSKSLGSERRRNIFTQRMLILWSVLTDNHVAKALDYFKKKTDTFLGSKCIKGYGLLKIGS